MPLLPLVHCHGSFLSSVLSPVVGPKLKQQKKTSGPRPNFVLQHLSCMAILVQNKLKASSLEFNVFITDANYYSRRGEPFPFSDCY